jgi:hypothetical protein
MAGGADVRPTDAEIPGGGMPNNILPRFSIPVK